MHALARFGLTTALTLISNLVLMLSMLPGADAQVRGRGGQELE
jgi:hypothetical protein